MHWHRAFLGAIIDLHDVNPHGDGYVHVMPKDASRRQVGMDIDGALQHHHITMAQAAKARGRSGWVGAKSIGRLGRLGLSVLKHLQHMNFPRFSGNGSGNKSMKLKMSRTRHSCSA